jgi:hypothetical protein
MSDFPEIVRYFPVLTKMGLCQQILVMLPRIVFVNLLSLALVVHVDRHNFRTQCARYIITIIIIIIGWTALGGPRSS